MSNTKTVQPAPSDLRPLSNAQWREENDKYMTPNFGTRRLALVRGEGTRVWDADGNEYLDFLAGISVNNLGHCHPAITKAIQRQAETLVHCTNLYYIPVEIELARLLVENSFADHVFFGNSGAEANEAAIKIARRWIKETRGAGHHEIVSMKNSFHGRTLATLSATGQEKVWQHFEPLVEGFSFAEFNNLDSVASLVNERTGAILVEPIQGEGGIHIASREFLQGLRELSDKHNLLLIFDEVQCGLGRAGNLFAYQHDGVQPDIMTLAKSLGGGLAMGAMLCNDRVAGAFAPGSHGSTMGGNPVTCAAALAYVGELIAGDWPAKAEEMGKYMMGALTEVAQTAGNFKEMRGRGLMIGMEINEGAAEILEACEKKGLLFNVTAGQTMRFLPPLNVTRAEVDRAVAIVGETMAEHAKTSM